MSWDRLERGAGEFDFGPVDDAIAMAQIAGKGLTLEVLVIDMPADLLADPSVSTWTFPRIGNRRDIPTGVPWDRRVLARYEAFLTALAEHPTPDLATGGTAPLARHPTLMVMDAPIPGLQGLRDLSNTLVSREDYDRAVFIDAVVRAVIASRTAFLEKYGFLAVFAMEDADHEMPLDAALMERLMAAVNHQGQPTLGLFQETLTGSGPHPERIGALLARYADEAYVMFQALTSWTHPFTGADRVAGESPSDGIQFGYDTYGATYFELYRDDFANGDFAGDLCAWNARLLGEGEGGRRARE